MGNEGWSRRIAWRRVRKWKKKGKDVDGNQFKSTSGCRSSGGSECCSTAELVSTIFNQCSRDFVPKFSGLIKGKDGPYDPLSIHLFHPSTFLGVWAAFREALLVEGLLNRKNKEILGVFVSNSNKCNFCRQTHMLAAQSQGADVDEMKRALSIAGPLSLHHKHLGRIIEWVIAAQTRGAPTYLDCSPIPKAFIPEILGVTFFFNYMNRIVDTFITRDHLPPTVPRLMKFVVGKSCKIREMVDRWLVRYVFGAIRGTCSPGDSINLIQHKHGLPKDFSWAHGNKTIAAGFGYWAGAMEDMAKIYIPTNVKEFVTKFIVQNYTGVEDHLTKQWAFMVSSELKMTPPEKYATTFMILVAFAPFEIDMEVLEGLKKHFPSNKMRRAFGMWSAFQAASTIACWQYRTICSRRS